MDRVDRVDPIDLNDLIDSVDQAAAAGLGERRALGPAGERRLLVAQFLHWTLTLSLPLAGWSSEANWEGPAGEGMRKGSSSDRHGKCCQSNLNSRAVYLR